jgi:hypothetical protein
VIALWRATVYKNVKGIIVAHQESTVKISGSIRVRPRISGTCPGD